ncbi:MAG TPA: hypothetical protein DD423_08600 [Opitutae bacterium]|jgi:hypothetical protein|nr:hypothetical protein [Opitutae bacterium]
MMRRTFLFLSFLLSSQFIAAAEHADVAHLKGIAALYMNVDTSMATDIQSSERLDMNDIMELQLRRSAIDLSPYVVNQPEANVPLVELSIDTSSRVASGEFELVLRLRDFVTIDRNRENTVATVFEIRRRGSSNSKHVEVIKAELRDLMSDFVAAFRQANPVR